MSRKRTTSQPTKKRARLNANIRTDKGQGTKSTKFTKSTNVSTIQAGPAQPQRITLTNLPIELLAEILLYTCSPPTVLAVSRSCSFLNRSLAHNPVASFIWRGVRETCKPLPLPEPGKAWKGTEAQYAAFVFDGGRCEICRKNTRAMYVSFATRIRLCGSHYCLRKFSEEHLVDATEHIVGQNRESIWVPYVESDRYSFRSHPPTLRRTWPYNESVLFRESDYEKFKRDLLVYSGSEQAKATSNRTAAPVAAPGAVDGRNGPVPQGNEGESREAVVKRCNVAVERFPEIMALSVGLFNWRLAYDQERQRIKKTNECWSKLFAATEGWIVEDLFISDAFSSLLKRKNFLLEEMGRKDIAAIRPAIETQLLERQARRNHQKAEAAYSQKLTEVKKIYHSLRCGTLTGLPAGTSGTTDPGNKMILPPLHVFCDLPSVRTLKGRPDSTMLLSDGNASALSSIQSSPLAKSLIVSDIQAWLIPVRSYLMGLLGFLDGWQSASMKKVHPLERVTARFLCRRCRDGGVGRQHQREGCLDFRGVCSHTCTSSKRKIADDKRRETQQETSGEHTEGEGDTPAAGGTKKTGRERTYDWKVDVFEKDEKAIRFINKVLKAVHLSDDNPATASLLNNLGAIECKSCDGYMMMDFETAIGHAHRHEDMEISILPCAPASIKTLPPDVAKTLTPRTDPHHEFERGIAERVLDPACSAKKLRSKVDYGCRHCPSERVKAMNFDGLRSHVKAKHGIQDIRDEDVFLFSSYPSSGVTK